MKDTKHPTARRHFNLFAALLSPALLATLFVGCGSEPKSPPTTAAQAPASTAQAPASTAKPDMASPTSGSIHIDEKITKACGDLPTAHFAFDSAAIGPDAASVLDGLARCFVSGPLKGRSMRLVG